MLYLCFWLHIWTAISFSTQFRINQSNGRIIDSYGRERIFHGLNVVVKGPPWLPEIDYFDPSVSFTQEDIIILKSLGVNVVRLGVMWPGVESSKGYVNETYLELAKQIVTRLSDNGIYTLVEMHQDVLSSRFCGEGVPSWLIREIPSEIRKPSNKIHLKLNISHVGNMPYVSRELLTLKDVKNSETSEDSNLSIPCFFTKSCKSPMDYAKTFPEPLAPRYIVENTENGTSSLVTEPSQEQCLSHAWGKYHFSYAVARAYQDLYTNKWGWRDAMTNYWAIMARFFKNVTGILGFELMNEPWVGDQFSDPTLLIPGVADKKNLAFFFDKLQVLKL